MSIQGVPMPATIRLQRIIYLATAVIEDAGQPEHTRIACEQIRQAAIVALSDLGFGPMEDAA